MGRGTQRWWLALTGLVLALLPLATAAQAGTPAATPLSAGGWRVADERSLSLAGEVAALSPDGAWLVGANDDGAVCAWALPGGEETCAGEGMGIDPDSFAWSPDGSTVAFAEAAAVRLIDSDLMVFTPATGELTNLTDDGVQGALLAMDATAGETLPVDIAPVWSPDGSRLAFARSVITTGQFSALPSVIMTIPRTGGEPAVWATAGTASWSIYSRMYWLSDGSLLYSYLPAPGDAFGTGIWRLEPDGKRLLLVSGQPDDMLPLPLITAVAPDERLIAVMSGSRVNQLEPGDPLAYVVVDITTPAARSPIVTVPMPRDLLLAGPITFAPAGATVLAPGLSADLAEYSLVAWPIDQPEASIIEGATNVLPIGQGAIDWADNDTILVGSRDGSRSAPIVLTLAPTP